jgi:hypothetical protein
MNFFLTYCMKTAYFVEHTFHSFGILAFTGMTPYVPIRSILKAIYF